MTPNNKCDKIGVGHDKTKLDVLAILRGFFLGGGAATENEAL